MFLFAVFRMFSNKNYSTNYVVIEIQKSNRFSLNNIWMLKASEGEASLDILLVLRAIVNFS